MNCNACELILFIEMGCDRMSNHLMYTVFWVKIDMIVQGFRRLDGANIFQAAPSGPLHPAYTVWTNENSQIPLDAANVLPLIRMFVTCHRYADCLIQNHPDWLWISNYDKSRSYLKLMALLQHWMTMPRITHITIHTDAFHRLIRTHFSTVIHLSDHLQSLGNRILFNNWPENSEIFESLNWKISALLHPTRYGPNDFNRSPRTTIGIGN